MPRLLFRHSDGPLECDDVYPLVNAALQECSRHAVTARRRAAVLRLFCAKQHRKGLQKYGKELRVSTTDRVPFWHPYHHLEVDLNDLTGDAADSTLIDQTAGDFNEELADLLQYAAQAYLQNPSCGPLLLQYLDMAREALRTLMAAHIAAHIAAQR